MPCQWCGMEVGRVHDVDGNHTDFFGCKAALKLRVAELERENANLRNELIDERVQVAYQTERLECCRSCPHEKHQTED